MAVGSLVSRCRRRAMSTRSASRRASRCAIRAPSASADSAADGPRRIRRERDRQLLDQPVHEHPLDRAIERARAEARLAVGERSTSCMMP